MGSLSFFKYSVLVGTIFCLATCSVGKMKSNPPLSSGTVIYDLSLEPNEDMKELAEGFGTQATLYFNPRYTRVEKNGENAGKEFYLTELSTGIGTNYLDLMGKKFGLQIPKDQQPSIVDFQYFEESKVVAGYSCKKATASLDGKEVTIYYTPEIKIDNLPYTNEFRGFALEYNLPMPIGNIHYKATKVLAGPVDESLLSPPEGYRLVSPMELQRELMRSMRSTPVGKAPDFTLTDLSGQLVRLQALQGQVVVLNFWFTTCMPCIAEMPDLNALKAEYKEREVQFLALTFEQKREVERFLKKNTFEFQILPEAQEVIGEYGIMAFPTTIVLDKEGSIVDSITGGSANIKGIIREMIESALKS